MKKKKALLCLIFSAISILIMPTKIISQQSEQSNGILIFLLDNSGSMACFKQDQNTPEMCDDSKLPRGRLSKIGEAKQEIRDKIGSKFFISKELSPKKIGFIEFGGEASDNLGTLCKVQKPTIWDLEKNPDSDSVILSNISRVNKNFEGTTPITLALREAMKYHSKNRDDGPIKILLLSDGGANCDETEASKSDFLNKSRQLQDELKQIPKPCDYIASEISKGHLDKDNFYFHIIGLVPSEPNDYEQFKCLTKKSKNFTFTPVQNPKELQEALNDSLKDNNWTIKKSEGSSITIIIIIPIILIGAGILWFIRDFIGELLINLGNGLVKTGKSLKTNNTKK
jgi:hypothetical protein